jgi:hypothetical protein
MQKWENSDSFYYHKIIGKIKIKRNKILCFFFYQLQSPALHIVLFIRRIQNGIGTS